MERNYLISIILLLIALVPASFSSSIKVESCVDYRPNIVICNKNSVSKYRVERAVRFWENLGYSFGTISSSNSASECVMSDDYGTIFILDPDHSFEDSYLAMTKRFMIKAYEKSYTLYSRIYISKDEAKKDRVLEHEIGHALGWGHIDEVGHMMHEGWDRGGYAGRYMHMSSYSAFCPE